MYFDAAEAKITEFDDAPQPVAVTDVGIEPAGTSEDPFVRATLALIPVGLA